jgi:hypothetical protein
MATTASSPTGEDVNASSIIVSDEKPTSSSQDLENETSKPSSEKGEDGDQDLQPMIDPNDPLNWSFAKKHLFLFIVACTAFMSDYGSSTGAITNLVQPAYVLFPYPTFHNILLIDKSLNSNLSFEQKTE